MTVLGERGLRERIRRPSAFDIAIGLLCIVVLALVVYPISALIVRLLRDFGADSLASVVTASWFGPMLRDTLVIVLASSVITVLLAGTLAWIQERTDAGLGPIGDVLPLIPLFLPGIAMAIGWKVLATPDVGFLNGMLASVFEPLGISPEVNIHSYAGLIFVYVLHNLPYAYLPIAAAFRNLDPNLEEAARVSGARPLHVLRTISLPAIGPALLAGFVLCTVIGFSLYSVPVILGTPAGIETLSVKIIDAIHNTYPPKYDVAALLSLLLFIILAALWYAQTRVAKRARFAQVGGRLTAASHTKLGAAKWIPRTVAVVYVLLASVIPLATLLLVSFQAYWQPDISASIWTLQHYDRVIFNYPLAVSSIQNSVSLGLVGGGITVLVGAILIVFATRRRGLVGRAADSIGKLPAAVPHAVLAVAFIFAFAGPPFALAGTILILGLAYFVTYLPYAVITSEASVGQVHPSLEEASRVSGAGSGRTFRSIIVPLVSPGLFAAWALVYVKVLGDLEVAVLLGSGRTPLIGFVLLDVYEQGSFNQVAALAIAITVLTLPVVMLMIWFGKPRWRRPTRATRGRARVTIGAGADR